VEESCFASLQESPTDALATESNAACFFDQDIVHYEFVPEGQTINQDRYLEVLRRVRDAVGRKRP
jgi:hypothetical protein